MAHLRTFFFSPPVFLLFSLQAKKEFEPPTQFIKLLYQQVFLWLMLPHFPFGVLLALVMWFVQFHIDAFVLTTFNAKPVTETHCNTLQHSAAHASYCNTLQRIFAFCGSCSSPSTPLCSPLSITNWCLQRIAPHCNALQRAASQCNTLQQTFALYGSCSSTSTHLCSPPSTSNW